MSRRVDHLLTLVRADPRLPLDLRQMAELVNVSVPHLCDLFKKETGTPAARSVKLAKMEISADLLTGTFLSVKEIVEMCGFRDESHFVRDFKKIYGMRPSEYRKNKANGNGHVLVPHAVATGQSVSVPRAVATGPIKSREQPRAKGPRVKS